MVSVRVELKLWCLSVRVYARTSSAFGHVPTGSPLPPFSSSSVISLLICRSATRLPDMATRGGEVRRTTVLNRVRCKQSRNLKMRKMTTTFPPHY